MDSVGRPLCGFSGKAWPTLWMQELVTSGLPGLDCVIAGLDMCCRKWLALLQTSPNTFFPDAAAEMSVHGLRSCYIRALTQVRARRSDRERVGRWRPGSAMAHHNDAMGCTAGLMVRKRVAGAVKCGSRLNQPNEMPIKVPYVVRLRRDGRHATCE